MSVGPFDPSPVIDRLKALCPQFKLIAGAAEFASAQDGGAGVQSPSAYVVVADENAAPPRGSSGPLIQQVNVRLAIVICVRNYASAALGAAAGADARSAIGIVRDALLNWMPPGCELVLEHVSGALKQYDNGTLWWMEVFATRYAVRKESNP